MQHSAIGRRGEVRWAVGVLAGERSERATVHVVALLGLPCSAPVVGECEDCLTDGEVSLLLLFWEGHRG